MFKKNDISLVVANIDEEFFSVEANLRKVSKTSLNSSMLNTDENSCSSSEESFVKVNIVNSSNKEPYSNNEDTYSSNEDTYSNDVNTSSDDEFMSDEDKMNSGDEKTNLKNFLSMFQVFYFQI